MSLLLYILLGILAWVSIIYYLYTKYLKQSIRNPHIQAALVSYDKEIVKQMYGDNPMPTGEQILTDPEMKVDPSIGNDNTAILPKQPSSTSPATPATSSSPATPSNNTAIIPATPSAPAPANNPNSALLAKIQELKSKIIMHNDRVTILSNRNKRRYANWPSGDSTDLGTFYTPNQGVSEVFRIEKCGRPIIGNYEPHGNCPNYSHVTGPIASELDDIKENAIFHGDTIFIRSTRNGTLAAHWTNEYGTSKFQYQHQHQGPSGHVTMAIEKAGLEPIPPIGSRLDPVPRNTLVTFDDAELLRIFGNVILHGDPIFIRSNMGTAGKRLFNGNAGVGDFNNTNQGAWELMYIEKCGLNPYDPQPGSRCSQ